MQQDRMISVAADYADALLVVRRVKRTMLLLLALILVAQIAIFSAVHWDLLRTTASATSQPGAINAASWQDILHYVTSASMFASVLFGVVLLATLTITIHIMLVGRLIGVALVVRAFVLAVFLLVLMFPWQTLLVTQTLGHSDFVPPGVLFSWREIQDRVPNHGSLDSNAAILYWARFMGMPIFSMIIVLMVQKRSGRGLKLALGEEEILPAAQDYSAPSSR